MRVAVSQFATTSIVEDNLVTCLRMIDEAAQCKPAVIVLPEFCNTHFWYVDHNQAWDAALTIEGPFLQAISAQAKNHLCYISLSVTLRRDQSRDHQDGDIKSNISVSSCLFSPNGQLTLQVNKQTLIGHEQHFFISASNVEDKGLAANPAMSLAVTEESTQDVGTVRASPSFCLSSSSSSSSSTLALLAGSDSLSFELARELTTQGAQLLCQSLNTYSKDQSSLHSPARAAENKVFIASANKIGSLLPEEHFDAFSEQHFIPSKYLVGAGESQIISPEGKVLAKIANNEEGVVFADIDLEQTQNKVRPDGTELCNQKRPELYQTLLDLNHLESSFQASSQDDSDSHSQVNSLENINKTPVTANVAIFATYKNSEQAIEDVCHYIENNLSDIIQLPELFFVGDKSITNDTEQLKQISRLSESLIEQISNVLRPFQYVCTSLVIDGNHQAALISEHGLMATQQQLHFCKRYQWTALGDELAIITLPLEQGNINVAMLTGDDANIAEIVRISAQKGIHLLLVPFDIQEACEVQYSLLSRAAENRICIVAASREKSFADNSLSIDNSNGSVTGNSKNKNKNKIKLQKSTGLIANLSTDFTLFTQWNSRKFDGNINHPLVKYQFGKITKALVHPIAATNKHLTCKINLLRDVF